MRQISELAVCTVAFAVLVFPECSVAHTADETNAVVCTMLCRLSVAEGRDRPLPRNVSIPIIPSPRKTRYDPWTELLDGIGDGWTVDEKKGAFNWYLSTLGTNVWNVVDEEWDSEESNDVAADLDSIFAEHRVRVALSFCRRANHTNAWHYLKALAQNPHGIYREDAVELAIKFGPIDDAMTDFVISTMTNTPASSPEVRGVAGGEFSDRLLSCPETNDTWCVFRKRAAEKLYCHRFTELFATIVFDELFVRSFDGFSSSSNRLEFANFVLAHPECTDQERRHFTSITNQLLSSGQPLRQVNLDAGGER